MLRVIFDTNIYGHLVKEPDAEIIEENITNNSELIVYGYVPIRKEMRDVPKATKLSRQTRILLLKTYDKIIGNHLLPHSVRINHLAKKYYDYYIQAGGSYAWESSLRINFMIVACASIHKLDIIYSDDNKTLSNKTAIRAYAHVNAKEGLETPNFLKYEDLLQKFRVSL